MAVWKESKGGCEQLALNADITNVSGSLATSATPSGNWPTGVHPFVIKVGAETAHEEKMLVTSRSGSTYTIGTRGYDGTTAVAHSAGESIAHCIDAVSMQEHSTHVNDTSTDNHTQYLTTGRHDVTARHTFGAAFTAPSAPPSTAAANAAGSAAGPARSDHTHAIGAGTVVAGSVAVGGISAANQFAAGVVDGTAIAAAIKDAAAGTPSLRTLSTTSTTAAAGNDARLSDTRTPTDASVTAAKMAGNVMPVLIPFTRAGTLVTGTGTIRFRLPVAMTIVHVRLAVGTAPTGAAILVDVNKNGTTIFTTQGNRPTIAISAFAETATTAPDVTAMAAGDYFTVDVDQVGSTIAGADLSVIIYCRV